MAEDEYVLRTTSFDTGETTEVELNQTHAKVHPEEFMDLMDAEVLKKTNVPLYFDNGVDERVLIGTATIEPDGEVTMQVDVPEFAEDLVPVESLSYPRMSIQPKLDIEELWAKRRTY